ncbi:MAG: ABC transporter permease [Trueperaceae bacterium]|nr:ABC transporter permease [Trueperaceae bacterium]
MTRSGTVADPALARPPESLWRKSLRRLTKNVGAMVGLVVIVALVLVAVFAPSLAPHPPNRQNPLKSLQAPSAEHRLGTDQFGRDILSRLIYGTRVSLRVGLIAVGIAALIGVPFGLIAGYYGGWLDMLISRVVDLMLAFPGILLALVIVSILGPSLFNVMVAVGIAASPNYARVVRGSVLAAKENVYVESARAVGARVRGILVRHILPNILAPVIVLATLGTAGAILSAAALSFLGLGAQPPTAEWGAMLSEGRNYMRLAWWVTTFPGLAIMVTVLAVNLLGDGLRDSLDVRMRA